MHPMRGMHRALLAFSRSHARLSIAASVVLACLSVPALAEAQSWFPLDTGRVWILEDGATRTVKATERDETGEIAFAEERFENGLGFEIRWHVDREGNIHVLGYTDREGNFSFDPPLLWLPAKLEKGTQWQNRSVRLDSDGKPVGTVEQVRHAAGEERLEFRWGTVDAMRVESTGDRLPVVSISSRESDPEITVWVVYYARGLGLVRHGQSERPWVDVIGFGTGFVRTERTNWGSCKSWFSADARSR